MLPHEYKHSRKQFWGRHLWARGYLEVSYGTITDEMIKEYTDEQDGEQVGTTVDFQSTGANPSPYRPGLSSCCARAQPAAPVVVRTGRRGSRAQSSFVYRQAITTACQRSSAGTSRARPESSARAQFAARAAAVKTDGALRCSRSSSSRPARSTTSFSSSRRASFSRTSRSSVNVCATRS